MRTRIIACVFCGVCLAAAVADAQRKPPGPGPAIAPGAPAAPKPSAAGGASSPSPGSASAGAKPGAGNPSGGASPAAAPLTPNPDEAMIRRAADAFVKAYDAKEAAAVAALFAPDGVIFDSQGAAQQGRDAITAVFADVFQQHPRATMQVKIDSVLFVTPSLAIEEGATSVTREPGEAPERMRYSVTHVKQASGKWLMASARDIEDEDAAAESELEQLNWLVGEWVDEGAGGLIKSSYAWNDSHTFLLCEYSLHIAGQRAMTGSERIGWDPLADQIHSWVFDSSGGFGEGLWTRDRDRWIVKLTGVTRDGKIGSATQVFTRVSNHKYSFESRDRLVGGEASPDIGPVSVVRSPPGPQTTAKPASGKP